VTIYEGYAGQIGGQGFWGGAAMSMSVLNSFCRQFDYVFVEEWQERGQPVFCFLDFHGARLRFTADQISRRLSGR